MHLHMGMVKQSFKANIVFDQYLNLIDYSYPMVLCIVTFSVNTNSLSKYPHIIAALWKQ
ncbi:hypothetical protein HanPSC8_Chr14g0626551 [Helianthus annuus]|nr:hypothetical protein HanPSC8_Chr14g0626551 [Helianthus annuus]